MVYAKITGVGTFLPPEERTNQQLVDLYGLDDYNLDATSIERLTGIKTRWVKGKMSNVGLMVQASIAALEDAGEGPIDTLVVATDNALEDRRALPGKLYGALRSRGKVTRDARVIEDLYYCSGFVEGLEQGGQCIVDGSKRALVVGMSGASDYVYGTEETRGTDPLWGDGGGAMVLEPSPEPGILAYTSKTYPEGIGIFTEEHLPDGRPYLGMDGRKLWRVIKRYVPSTITGFVEDNMYKLDDVAQIIMHQFNGRGLTKLRKDLGVAEEKFMNIVANIGNVIAASIPMAYRAALDMGRIKEGQLVMFSGFGVGKDAHGKDTGLEANVLLYRV